MKLFTSKQMKSADTAAITQYGIPSLLLMEHAAFAIFNQLIKRIHQNQRIHILCGTGNNGGDGFALARLLYQHNYKVSIQLVGDKQTCSNDCEVYYTICKNLEIPIEELSETHDIIVDAMFGIGLSRVIQDPYASLIKQMNTMNKKVFSIDIPSGVCADTGNILGCAVKATQTYTIQVPKVGLYLGEGRVRSGQISVCDIFIPQQCIDNTKSNIHLMAKENMYQYLPPRNATAHKGTYGKVLCIGGSETMSGAICMASLSALKSGCGLLTCAVPTCINDTFHHHVLEAMSIPLQDKDGYIHEACIPQLSQIESYTCTLIGCGLGRKAYTAKVVEEILNKPILTVLDADALYFIKDRMHLIHPQAQLIITPHIKEFATLINKPVSEVMNNSLALAQEFCLTHRNIVLVLKSSTTIIAYQDQVYINTYGNNGLSVGGSGDVLAGIITGLLAQHKQPLAASILGVFLHAYSADQLLNEKSVYSLLPSDIIHMIENTLKILDGENNDKYISNEY